MKGDSVRFKSMFTALDVLRAANKYMVKKIDILALKFIRKNVSEDHALMILQNLYFLRGTEDDCEDLTDEDLLPSAPTLGKLMDALLISQLIFVLQTWAK